MHLCSDTPINLTIIAVKSCFDLKMRLMAFIASIITLLVDGVKVGKLGEMAFIHRDFASYIISAGFRQVFSDWSHLGQHRFTECI